MLDRVNILIARTCSYQAEHPRLGSWLFHMGIDLGRDERVGACATTDDNRHRIHNSRNHMARYALDNGFHYLCFVDPDMHPDFRVGHDFCDLKQQPDARPWARPFLRSSLDFMLTTQCGVVASPAVSGPPARRVNVWTVKSLDEPPVNVTPDEFARMKPGFVQVAAIGTGLMLIDVDVFRKLPEPWFEDVYHEGSPQYDPDQSQDCAFCFKCNQHRIAVYANLFAPSRHMKTIGCDPPDFLEPEPCKEPDKTLIGACKPAPSPAEPPNPRPSISPVLFVPPRLSQRA